MAEEIKQDVTVEQIPTVVDLVPTAIAIPSHEEEKKTAEKYNQNNTFVMSDSDVHKIYRVGNSFSTEFGL